MMKLLETGKSPLLDKFISKKGRPFSAYLVRQPDGKIGFEFEAREPKAGGKGGKAAAAVSPGALRVLGKHPVDDQIISIYSGRYGPYIRHGATNATIRDKDKVESITLEEAVELLAEKAGVPVKKKAAKAKPKTAAKATAKSAVTDAVATTTPKAPAVKKRKRAA